MTREPSAASWRYRVIGWMLRHPSRLGYVIAEFSRPLSIGQKIDNAWFHIRHWNDVAAWRAQLERSGLDDSCT